MLLIVFQQKFDNIALSTMQATVQSSALLFALIMVFGAFFLLEYVTAILCITYAEISATHEDFADTRVSPEQMLLQIGLSEGHNDGDKVTHDDSSGALTASEETSANAVTEHKPELPRRAPHKKVTIDDLQPAANSKWTERFWSSTRRHYREWSRREPKTKDVLSYPMLNYYGEVNMEAIERIKKRVQETSRQDSTVFRWMRVGFDTMSYVLAGAIQFPTPASEMYGARGWQGNSDKGVVSPWEWSVTALSVLEVANQIIVSTSRIKSRQDGVEPSFEQSYGGLTSILWILFACDMAIKIIAFKGPWYYAQSSLNLIDATVTTVQLFGMTTLTYPSLAGLRIMRWIAIGTLSRNISSLHIVIEKAFGCAADACMSIALSFMFIGAMAVFGQQIYAGVEWTDYRRSYFGTFGFSLVSVIEISSNGGLLDMIQQGLTAGPHTTIYLMFTVFFINLLISRILVPFMLRQYEESEAFKIRYQIFFGQVVTDGPMWEHTRQHAKLLAFFRVHQSDDHVPEDFLAQAEEFNQAALREQSLKEAHTISTSKAQALLHRGLGHDRVENHVSEPVNAKSPLGIDSPGMKKIGALSLEALSSKNIKGAVAAWHSYGHLLHPNEEESVSELRRFKKAFTVVLNSSWYEPLISALVVFNCYVFSGPRWLNWSDWVRTTLKCSFLAFFQCEMVLLMWVSYGKSLSKTAYYKDPWRILELFAIVGMWFVIIPVLPYWRGIANLRFLQLARSLRAMSVFPDIQLAYDRLGSLKVDFFHCLTLIACLILGFTTLSMPLFGGLFSSCDDASAADRRECSGTYYSQAGSPGDEIYILRSREWGSATENFDSFPSALGTSFALFLNTGWSEVLARAMSLTAAGIQPLQYGTGVMGLVLVAYQLLAMVLRQLLIAMVINNLKETSGTGLQTDVQKAWIATQRMCESKCVAYRVSRDSTGGRGWSVAKDIKSHPAFRIIIELTIGVNIVTMLCVSYGASQTQEGIMQYINAVCLIVYYFEMITALVAEAHVYFLNGWNIFDGIINIVSTIDLYYWYTSVDGSVDSLEIMSVRSARVLRLIKLAGRSPQISILLRFTAKAIRTSIGCYLVWFLLMVLFAIPASSMFSHTRQSEYVDLTTQSNFVDFGHSMLFLFRIAVQNNFAYPASDLAIQEPYCTATNYTLIELSADQTEIGDCGTDILSVWIFFTCFTALSRLVIVPFIAGCGGD